MKNRFTLFFAALLMTLGVCAQTEETQLTPEQIEANGVSKGYYPFAAEITGMEKLTSLNQITDGMEIMIERDGSYITIYSLNTGGEGGYHQVFMQEKPVGVGVWTTEAVSNKSNTYRLKTAHMTLINDVTKAKCYLGKPFYNNGEYKLNSSNQEGSIGEYIFTVSSNGKWTLHYTSTNWNGTTNNNYLCVNSKDGELKISQSNAENCIYFALQNPAAKQSFSIAHGKTADSPAYKLVNEFINTAIEFFDCENPLKKIL